MGRPRCQRHKLCPLLIIGLLCFCISCFFVHLQISRRRGFIIRNFATNAGQTGSHRSPQVVIVEEHHEVMKYWFEAADRGIIPDEGNILVHIDGHSDMAVPTKMNGYPPFRRPRSPWELQRAFQSNDNFIQASVMAGLIKRAMWVWPSWDVTNHDAHYQKETIEIGLANVTVSDSGQATNHTQTVFCSCVHEESHVMCEYNGDSSEVSIPVKDCKIKRSFIAEDISEKLFMKLLNTNKFFHPEDKVLLDIDEDYFGCENALTPVTNAGVSWEQVNILNRKLGQFLCPNSTSDEFAANSLVVKIIKEILNKCKSAKKISCARDLDNEIHFHVKKYFVIRPQIFCDGQLNVVTEEVQPVIEELKVFTKLQLESFLKVGFCMKTTTKSLYFQEYRDERTIFRTCHGFNVKPNQSMVLHFTPSRSDVMWRLHLLNQMLQHSHFPSVHMVTLCRSIRDGYTPRKYFPIIEQGILQNFDYFDRVYDADLLGGPNGWHHGKY